MEIFGLKEEHLMVIFMCLFAMSEALALIPAVKANSIFEMVQGVLKKIKEALEKKK